MFSIDMVNPRKTNREYLRTKRNQTVKQSSRFYPRRSYFTLRIALVWMLLLVSLPGGLSFPQQALAQDVPEVVEQGLPDDEIVYIDAAGTIRVWDPYLSGVQQIQWASPIGGFKDFALGDVNNDGDEEIIAIREVGDTGFLNVYDPVLNSTSLLEDGEINGVPWKLLYELAIPGKPVVVGAGELDTGLAGDEIVYGYTNGSVTTVVVLNDTDQNPDGTAWKPHISAAFGFTWDKLTVADVDTDPGQSTDEVILVDSGDGDNIKSKLHVYRVNTQDLASASPLFKNENTGNRWRGTVVGQVYSGGRQEIVAWRSTANAASASTFIFKYRPENLGDPGGTFEESEGDGLVIFPRPEDLFLANINGTVNDVVDDEMFFLRKVGSDFSDPVRFFARNRGSDGIDEDKIDRSLNSDNLWREGVGGNIDGDVNGRDEVVIVRTDRIRIYRHESDGSLVEPVPSLATTTNNNSLLTGDLDKNGFFSGIELSTTTTLNPDGVQTGASELELVTIDVTSSGDTANLTAEIVGGFPEWVNDFNVSSGLTPSKITVGVDATNLLPGPYSFSVFIQSRTPDVTNPQITIPVAFDVLPAQLTLTPNAVSHVGFGSSVNAVCDQSAEAGTYTIRVMAPTRMNYSASVISQPDYETIEGLVQGHTLADSVDAAGVNELTNYIAHFQEQNAPEIGANGVITWHDGALDPTWIQVVSEGQQLDPSSLVTVTVQPSQIPTGTTSVKAHLIIAADARSGPSPNNFLFVPLGYLCAVNQVRMPLFQRPRTVIGQ
ncbi:MAG: hypothetical protein AAF702_14240 [Chloroflexota bacterium]